MNIKSLMSLIVPVIVDSFSSSAFSVVSFASAVSFTSAVSFVPAVSFATVVSFTSAVSFAAAVVCAAVVAVVVPWEEHAVANARTPAKAAVNNKFFFIIKASFLYLKL